MVWNTAITTASEDRDAQDGMQENRVQPARPQGRRRRTSMRRCLPTRPAHCAALGHVLQDRQFDRLGRGHDARQELEDGLDAFALRAR